MRYDGDDRQKVHTLGMLIPTCERGRVEGMDGVYRHDIEVPTSGQRLGWLRRLTALTVRLTVTLPTKERPHLVVELTARRETE
jgi:hypothetical protein